MPNPPTDRAVNELMLISTFGPARIMVLHRAAAWPGAGAPTGQQCSELLATQPLDRYEAMDLAAEDAALCLATSEENLAFLRVTGAASGSPGSGSVPAEVTTWTGA